VTATKYRSTKFGVDSKSFYFYSVDTHTHTDKVTDDTDHPIPHIAMQEWDNNMNIMQMALNG